MASFEGSIGTPSGWFNLRVDYSYTQSIEGNYSNVSATAYVKRNNSSAYPYNTQSSASLNINGTAKSYIGSYDLRSDGYKTITSNTVRVPHNSDGTKTITISFSFNGLLSSYYPNGSISKSITLPTIPRASTVACSSPNIGDTAIITIDKKSTNFTNTLTYEIGSLTGTIAEKTSETVLSLETLSLEEQIYALIPNDRSIQGKIYCDTYNGTTKIGDTQTTTFNLYTVSDNCKPTITGTLIDTNSTTIELTGDSSIIVKNASKPKVTIQATPNKSATIKSYLINLNDGQTSTEQEYTFDTINSNLVTVTVTDSRDYSNSYNIDLNDRTIEYIRLHFNTIDLARTEDVSNEIILNADGVYYNGVFNETDYNTLDCSFKYRESGTTNWIDGGTLTPTISGNTFKLENISLGNIYDYEKEYQFKIIAQDLLLVVGDNNQESQTVPKGSAIVEVGEDFVNINGEILKNNLPIESGDSIPINSIFEYEGSDIPVGYEKVEDENEYSLEEQIIGKWIDGKILYRKCFSKTNVSTGSTNVGNISNLENVITIRGAGLTANVDVWMPVSNETASNDYLFVEIRDNNINVRSEVANWRKVFVIVEYTKTID